MNGPSDVAARLLTDAARDAGLTVTRMNPRPSMVHGHITFAFQMWTADGTLWAEGLGESADDIIGHIDRYRMQQGR